MDDERYSIGRSSSRTAQSLFGSWWILLGYLYLGLATMLLTQFGDALSRTMGRGLGWAVALLFGLVALYLCPLCAAMWWHVKEHDRRKLEQKARFLQKHLTDTLVVYNYNQQQVYKVTNRSAGGDRLEVTSVWNADGPVDQSENYSVDAGLFSSFDRATFLKQ